MPHWLARWLNLKIILPCNSVAIKEIIFITTLVKQGINCYGPILSHIRSIPKEEMLCKGCLVILGKTPVLEPGTWSKAQAVDMV